MLEIQNHIISEKATIKDALVALDALKTKDLNLFVQTTDGSIIGSVTDGDIRRGLIKGAQLDSTVQAVMRKEFVFFVDGEVDLAKLRYCKSKGMTLIPVLDDDKRIKTIYNIRLLKSILPIDAVLMAGGKGERLRPLTEKTPKPLLPVGDKAIIDHNIDRIISYGVNHISVTVNYLKEQIEAHYQEPRNGVQIQTVREPKFLGTIGSIRFVPTFYNDTVLVMNSDVFTNIDYEDFFLHFQQYDAEMSVAAIPYNVAIPYGIFDLDGRNIKGLIEKPKYNYYANAGIYLIKRRALEEIPADAMFHATDLIEKLISEGKKVVRYPLNGTWIDIGNPQEYQKANDLVKHMI